MQLKSVLNTVVLIQQDTCKANMKMLLMRLSAQHSTQSAEKAGSYTRAVPRVQQACYRTVNVTLQGNVLLESQAGVSLGFAGVHSRLATEVPESKQNLAGSCYDPHFCSKPAVGSNKRQ